MATLLKQYQGLSYTIDFFQRVLLCVCDLMNYVSGWLPKITILSNSFGEIDKPHDMQIQWDITTDSKILIKPGIKLNIISTAMLKKQKSTNCLHIQKSDYIFSKGK